MALTETSGQWRVTYFKSTVIKEGQKPKFSGNNYIHLLKISQLMWLLMKLPIF